MPTVVLVGGRLTLEDGTELDSRQPVVDPAMARAVLQTLTGAAEWWDAVASIVIPTLKDEEGGFAYTNQVTIGRIDSDGRVRRVRFPRYRRGPGEEDYIYNATLLDEARFASKAKRAKRNRKRGRRAGYLADLVAPAALRPRIRIDTTGATLASLATEGTYSAYVVLPDTAGTRAALLRSVGAGTNEGTTEGEAEWDDPTRYLRLPARTTECCVTGLWMRGAWRDAAALEAARRLLLERFDLRLGLWDLATSSALRDSVLTVAKVPDAPEVVAAPPQGAVRRAQLEGGDIASQLEPALVVQGWRRWGKALLHPIRGKANQPDHPHLRILVRRGDVRVYAWNWHYNRFDINRFVDDNLVEFEEIARLPARRLFSASSSRLHSKHRKDGDVAYEEGRRINDTRWVLLWSADVGWASMNINWSSVAEEMRSAHQGGSNCSRKL
jgi:hypothetical protein